MVFCIRMCTFVVRYSHTILCSVPFDNLNLQFRDQHCFLRQGGDRPTTSDYLP